MNLEKIDLLITHRNCDDGAACAAIMLDAGLVEPENIIYAQYNSTEAPDVTGKRVVIADFSFDRETIIKMHEQASFLVVIDHHKSAEGNLAGLDYCIFNNDRCGASLLYEYVYGEDRDKPKFIRYIQDKDLYEWKLPNSREFSSGFTRRVTSQLDVRPLSQLRAQDIMYDDITFRVLIDIGKPYVEYEDLYINKTVRGVLKKLDLNTFVIGGQQVVLLNNSFLINEVGNAISLETKLPVGQYFFKHDKIVFSLRLSQEVVGDVSKIAECYDGGGHANAGAFSISFDKLDISKFLLTRNMEQSIIG